MNKYYYTQYNVGKSKYVVSYHNGIAKHRDGSMFFDIAIFRNKVALAKFINTLKINGYIERLGI